MSDVCRQVRSPPTDYWCTTINTGASRLFYISETSFHFSSLSTKQKKADLLNNNNNNNSFAVIVSVAFVVRKVIKHHKTI